MPPQTRTTRRVIALTWILSSSLLFTCLASTNSDALEQPADLSVAKPTAQQAEDLTDMSFENLLEMPVQGASRFEQPLSEAPASVSIVTADQIRKYGYRNLADILRSLRGFYITYDRYTSYVGVRGFGRTGDYNSRILVLVDGHRNNDNIFDSVGVGNDFILDVDLIDRVEVIRGPSSSIYGNNAFFAVINIISRSGQQMKGLEISGEAGSLDTYKGRLSYGQHYGNGLDVMLSGSVLDSRGDSRLFFKEFNDPAHNNGIASNLDGERVYALYGGLSFKGFTLKGGYMNREKHIPTASFATIFNDPRYKEVDSGGNLDLKYEHTFGNDWEFMGRVFFDNREYVLHSPVAVADTAFSVLNLDTPINNWMGTDIQITKTLLDKHRLLIGGEFQHNFTVKFENHDVEPYFQYLDVNRTNDKWGLFLQDEYTIFPSLILNAGVRYDHFESFGGNVSPRLALINNPFAGTTLKLLYGEAFRAPNAFELYYDIPQILKSNPGLQPEKITTYELVLEQSLGEHLRLIATGFYNRIHNIIVQESDSNGVLVYRNKGEVNAKGAELEFEGKWPGGLEGRISYTYQDARDDGNARLANSPQHMAKAGLIVPIFREKIFGSAELQYMSSRLTLQGNESGDVFLTNLTLYSRKLIKRLELSGSIFNLFDKRYGDPGGGEHLQDVLNQDGRLFRLKLTYAF